MVQFTTILHHDGFVITTCNKTFTDTLGTVVFTVGANNIHTLNSYSSTETFVV